MNVQQPTTPRGISRWEMIAILAIISVLLGLIWPSTKQSGHGESIRYACRNNLKKIGVGIDRYHDAHGSFPPAFRADENGQPQHSWRVLLLPYVGEEELYSRYRFDEPWNGPHNAELLKEVPNIYRCPADVTDVAKQESASAATSYVAVIGPRTMFPGQQTIQIGDITDDASRTLAIVEVADSGIPWTEPRDLHIERLSEAINSKTGEGISSRHKVGAHCLRCDGRAWFLSEELSPQTLRQLLTIDDGQPTTDF